MNPTMKAVTFTLAMALSGAAFAAGGNTQGAAGVAPDSNRNSKNMNGDGTSGYGSPGTTGMGGGQGAGTGATPARAPSTMPGSQQSSPDSSQ